MDFRKFDELTRKLTTDTARRSIVKGGAAAALGALVGVFRHDAAEAGCKGKDKTCKKDGDCCSKKCGGNDKNASAARPTRSARRPATAATNDDECTGNGNKKCQPVT